MSDTATHESPRVELGIEKKDRAGVVEILDRLLSDEYVLAVKTKNYHWNVVGPHFGSLHELFNDQYEAIDKIVDQLAERVRTLGAIAPGTMRQFLEMSNLREQEAEGFDETTMLQDLLSDHETVSRRLREEVGPIEDDHEDLGTTDLLIDVLQYHEKTAWMLRAHLVPSGAAETK